VRVSAEELTARDLVEKIIASEKKIKDIQLHMTCTIPAENQTFYEYDWGYEGGKEFYSGIDNTRDSRTNVYRKVKVTRTLDGEREWQFRNDPKSSRPNGGIIEPNPNFSFSGGIMTFNTLLGFDAKELSRLSLGEAIAQAESLSVRDETELIDGRACYVIEAINLETDPSVHWAYDVRAWIDCGRDYRPLKFEKYRSIPGKNRFKVISRRVDNIKLKQIDGIWLPTEGERTTFSTNDIHPPEGMTSARFGTLPNEERLELGVFKLTPRGPTHRLEIDVDSIRLNKGIPPKTFTIDFPKGCEVYDEFAGKRYVVGEPSEKDAALSDAELIGQTKELSVGELIDILCDSRLGVNKKKWFAAIHRLVEIGSPAVPEIVAEIRRTEKPQTQSKLALTLRAIGDANAVPGLIDALERAGFSSDYGLGEPNTELERFYKTYQMDPAEESLGLGRPVREITVALERLTGHSEGHDHFDAYDSAGNRLGGYTITPEIRDRQKEHRRQVAEKWRVWWQANKDKIKPPETPPTPPVEPKPPEEKGHEGGVLAAPEGAQLTLAIVPNADDSGRQPSLTKEQYQKYLDDLAENGPFAGSVRGDSFQWSPIKGDAGSFKSLPLSTYKDRTYILLCARAQYVMMPEVEGRWIWGLEKVEATSNNGRPAINIWFDEKGAELLGELTKANIDNHLSIAVDGWVRTAPVVRARIRKVATITGDFTTEEVRSLVEDLKKGMPAVDQQAVEAMRRIAEAGEKLSKVDLQNMGPRQIVENLFVVGPAGDAEKLAWFFRSDSPAAKGITVHDFAQMADAHKTEVLEVYADANDALAVTSNIKGKDGEEEGRLIFYLSKQTGTWLIHDADIGDPQRVQDDVTRFKSKHPNAKLDSSSQAVDSTPGEALRCELKMEKPKVAFGEQPVFTATLTNAGSEPVDVMGYGDEPEGHLSYRLPLAGAHLEIPGYGIQGYDAPGAEPKAVRIEAGKSWSFEMPPPRVPRYADEPAHPLPNLQAYLPGKHTAQVIYSIRDYEKERFGPTLVFGADAGALAGKKPDKFWQGTVRSNEVTFEVAEDDSEALRIRRAVDSGEGIKENLTLELTCPATQIKMGESTQLNLTAKNTVSNMLYLGSNCRLRWKGPDGKEGSSLGLGAAEARQVGGGGSLVMGGWSFGSGQAPLAGTYQVWVEYTAGARPDTREAWVKSNVITLQFVEPGSVAESARSFTATLPNGVTVELVGICEHPSEGKQWWGVGGQLVPKPYQRLNYNERSADSKLYEVAYRLFGWDDILSTIYSNSEITGHISLYPLSQKTEKLNILDAANAYGAILLVKPDAQSIQLEMGIGRDSDWKTLCTQASPVDKTGTTGPGVVFQPAIEKDGKTHITIAHQIKDGQIRVIAVDHSGQIHESEGFLNTISGELGSCQIRFNLPAAQIKEIQFQTQKFERVTFKNISLRPGAKTDVEIKVESEKISGVVGAKDSTLGKSTSAEAAFIIQKVLDRYAAIKTYSAIGELLTDVNHPPGAMGAITGMTREMLQQMGEQQLKSIFTIKMARPNLYCIEWNENIDSDLSKVGNAWSVGDGSYGLILGKEKSSEKPLQALIWTASDMGKVQSSLFFDTSLNTLRMLRGLSQQEDEQLEGVECYVISGSRYRRTYTYWVSKKDFLIRRHKFVSGGDGKLIEGGGHEVTDETIKESLKAMDKEATPEEIAKTRAMLTAANAMASGVKVTNTETYRNIILDQPISKEQFVPSKDIDEITEELKNLRAQYIHRLENISPTEPNLKTDVQVEVESGKLSTVTDLPNNQEEPQHKTDEVRYEGRTIAEWISRFESESHDEQREAIGALARIGRPLVPGMIEEMKKGGIRASCARGVLGEMGPEAEEAVPWLIEVALDKDVPIDNGWESKAAYRECAVSCLNDMPWARDRVVPVLRRIAEDDEDDTRLRRVAVLFLRDIGKEAIPILRKLVEMEDGEIQNSAHHMLAQVLQKEQGLSKDDYYTPLIEKDPFGASIPEYLAVMKSPGPLGHPHPLTQKIKRLYRERLAKEPDAQLAWRLAAIIQEGLRNTELTWAAPTGWSKVRWPREDPAENFATLAEVLQLGFDHAESGSQLQRQFGISLAKLRLLQGDWDGMNSMLKDLGQEPIPKESRRWLAAPPGDWGEDLSSRWVAADESMRSGKCSLEFRIEKDGKGLKGVHFLVKRAPESTNVINTGISIDTLFFEPYPLKGFSSFGYKAADRPMTRYAVSDESGIVRFEKLPNIPIKIEVLVPTSNFPEAVSNWDLWMEVESGKYKIAKKYGAGAINTQVPPAVAELKEGQTVHYPNLVVRVEGEVAWGEAVNGLRAAVEFVPEKESYTWGEGVEVRFHIQNIGSEDAQFASESTRQDWATVKDSDGNDVKVDRRRHSGTVATIRHIIKPGQILTLKTSGLGFGDSDDPALVTERKGPWIGSLVQCGPGQYSISYPVNRDLKTGVREVTVTERQQVDPRRFELVETGTVAGSAAPEPNQTRGRIRGVVVSAESDKPIRGAYVGVGDFGDSGGSNYARHRSEGFFVKAQTDAGGQLFSLCGIFRQGSVGSCIRG
jgi:hypothetical protein